MRVINHVCSILLLKYMKSSFIIVWYWNVYLDTPAIPLFSITCWRTCIHAYNDVEI